MADNSFFVDYYNALGMRYEEAFGHNPDLHKFVQQALERLPPEASVLDVGCGTGKPTSSMIAASGRRLHGIDFSPTMIELSRKQVPDGTFELINMLDYEPPTPFDAVFATFSTLEFGRDELPAVVDKWAKWVVADGLLFIGTICADDFQTGVFDADGLYAREIQLTFMGDSTKESFFSRRGWTTMLEHAGFEIVQVETCWFQAPAEAKCDNEPLTFIIARKP